MKKVVILWSSPNTDGLTASAKDQIAKGLIDAGTDVEEIHLNKMHLEHCRACGNGWGTCNKKRLLFNKGRFCRHLSENKGSRRNSLGKRGILVGYDGML